MFTFVSIGTKTPTTIAAEICIIYSKTYALHSGQVPTGIPIDHKQHFAQMQIRSQRYGPNIDRRCLTRFD